MAIEIAVETPLQEDVRAIFEMTRLNKAVTIHGTRSEALGAWV